MNENEKSLFRLCSDVNFDKETALSLIKAVDINKELVEDERYLNIKSTFLSRASAYANIEMVRLLLENGADPNFILCADKPLYQENPFWDMQYPVSDDAAENETGLQIAQLMLEYWADPGIIIDEEDLFSYVLSAVFNDDDHKVLCEYRSRFLILLIAYGGANSYCKPEIIKDFDKSNMAQYRFNLVPAGDRYHLTGEIVDGKGEVIAIV